MSASLRSTLLTAALLACLPVPALAQAPAAPPVSYADALTHVLQNHESLKAADKEVRQREEERGAAKSLYWPKVDAAITQTNIDRPIDLDLNEIRTVILGLHPLVPASRIPPFVSHFQDANFWLANVNVTWPIYTGGKVAAANHAAEAQVQDATAMRLLAKESLSTELARRYFGLRLALSARQVRQQVLAALEQHLHDAVRLEEEGMISHAERLHAEVARSEADRELRKANHDVEIARAGLANILSDGPAGDPSSPLFLLPSLEPLDAFQRQAQDGHPAFRRFAAQRSLAEQALKAEKGRFLPDVYVFGMRQLHEGDLTILDPKWAFGIGAKVTLFDGFDRSHKTAAARLQQGRVDDLEQRTRRDVATLVERRYIEVARARDVYTALQPAEELAAENVRVRTRAFEEGLATSLDVVDARLSASRVELGRLAAAYDFDVALAELLEASGQSDRFETLRAAGAPVTVSHLAGLEGTLR